MFKTTKLLPSLALWPQVQEGKGCDVKLKSGNERVQCHRNVLLAQCAGLEKWLSFADEYGKSDVADLIPSCALYTFVELVYKGECELQEDAGLALIDVFKTLKMETVTQELLTWVWNRINKTAVELLALHQSLLTASSSYDDLLCHVKSALSHKFLDLYQTKEWNALSYEAMTRILGWDKLWIPNEDIRLYCALDWINMQPPKERQTYVQRLLEEKVVDSEKLSTHLLMQLRLEYQWRPSTTDQFVGQPKRRAKDVMEWQRANVRWMRESNTYCISTFDAVTDRLYSYETVPALEALTPLTRSCLAGRMMYVFLPKGIHQYDCLTRQWKIVWYGELSSDATDKTMAVLRVDDEIWICILDSTTCARFMFRNLQEDGVLFLGSTRMNNSSYCGLEMPGPREICRHMQKI